MRNFRQVALAGATALAVTFGSTAVASADTEPTKVESGPSLSHKIGKHLESDQEADGREIFGVQKEGFETQPAWAKLLYGLLVFNSAAAFFGLVVGPAYNFIVHGPINFR
ncbi:hypothetical protein [Corynebacterium mucifaciens]|uniref:Or membrane protein n=1 Tax=Corynebacterium mucifaciens TaxID=57171 RepID=A0A7X6REV0_9CORY|nr:hypothetical protein [Corynebacterium mucifaciens]NKY68673.1 hypothetical protein [Corynebacterium mucifaciens]